MKFDFTVIKNVVLSTFYISSYKLERLTLLYYYFKMRFNDISIFSTLNCIFSECYFMNMAAKTSRKLSVHIAPNFQDKYIIPKCTKQHGGLCEI